MIYISHLELYLSKPQIILPWAFNFISLYWHKMIVCFYILCKCAGWVKNKQFLPGLWPTLLTPCKENSNQSIYISPADTHQQLVEARKPELKVAPPVQYGHNNNLIFPTISLYLDNTSYIIHTWYPYKYLFMYIWRALFKNVLRHHSRKWAYHANVKFKDCVLGKTISHMYVYPYFYFMKNSFSKHDLRIWHWHCNINFWICA